MNKLLNKIIGVFLVLYCAFAVSRILIHNESYQWDFNMYYYSAKTWATGLNSYDSNTVSQLAKRHMFLYYAYSPITLPFFSIFTIIGYNAAYFIYFILKIAALICLIFLWRNVFFKKQVDIIFYLLCLLAFNSAIYLDLSAGNISIFEQLLMWLGFFYYLKHRFILFCVLIIVTSIFKIQPILLLLLLLFVQDKKKYLYLASSLIIFGLIELMTYMVNPSMFHDFMINATRTTVENGRINPSTFSILRDILQLLSKATGIVAVEKANPLCYLIVTTVIIFISLPAFNYLKSFKIEDKNKWIIYLTCLIYSLINIRFKDYSYIILIVPTYFIMKEVSCIKISTLLLFLAAISAFGVTLPGLKALYDLLWNYYPLVLAYFIWGLYLCQINFLRKQKCVEIQM